MSLLASLLRRPFLPPDARLRQQRLDERAMESPRYIAFSTPDVAVTLTKAVDGRGSDRGLLVAPTQNGSRRITQTDSPRARWYAMGRVEWDGRQVGVTGSLGSCNAWDPEPGGLLPGFDAAEAFRAGGRPVTSGECPGRVAAIATVGLAGHHLHRVYFLDHESRELGFVPALGLAEDDLVRVAEAAGIAYRSYALTLAKFSSLQVSPSGLCEALFPRSARRIKLASEEFDNIEGWYTEYPEPWG